MEINDFLSFDDTEIAFAHKSDVALWRSYLLFRLINNPNLVKKGTSLAMWALDKHLPITPFVRYSIYEQFCGGQSLKKAVTTLNKMAQYNLKTMLDYGVEAKKTEKDFDKTSKQLLKAITFAGRRSDVPVVSIKITGLGQFELFEAIDAAQELTPDQQAAFRRVKQRLHTICQTAQKENVAIYFDAEESWIQDALDVLVNELMAAYNRQAVVVYNTFQLYRHDRLAYLKQCHTHALQGGYILGAKLVRGAYMEKERERAWKMGYASPIQPDKEATDRDFNDALLYCIDHLDQIAFCNASHNEQSATYLCRLIAERKLPRDHAHIWFAQLYGMSDHISYNLANTGYNAAKYLPYGPVRDVVPYLIRRAQENTSVAGQAGRELSLLQDELRRRKAKSWWRWLPV